MTILERISVFKSRSVNFIYLLIKITDKTIYLNLCDFIGNEYLVI